MRRRLLSLVTWWVHIPKPIKWLVYCCLPAGIAMAGLGIYGDEHGWWNDRGFLTNLLSSFTGLLIGVPFALVVLSHLGGLQADAANYRAAVKSGRNAAIDFEGRHRSGFVRYDLHHAESDLIRLRTANAKYRQAVETWVRDPSPTRSGDVCAAFERRRELIRTTFTHHRPIHPWLTMISESWHRLDMEVRPRLLDVEANWMPRGSHVALRSAVRTLDGARSRRLMGDHGPSLRHLGRHSQGEAVESAVLENAIDHLRDDAEAAHEVIIALLAICKELPALNNVGV
ncbi:hypothetical protein [Streptomyces sp. t39]|uniref:hypothetical protein n=1 Tax=Streptomyces sp. t39 TaxID=1828156 RepID=UPI0011CD5F70|nr:hypothetical protein [Streptomyces sp. t39]TXS56544.1 hypothetical protein EAO77_10780 [Streptomyces sp. t39]